MSITIKKTNKQGLESVLSAPAKTVEPLCVWGKPGTGRFYTIKSTLNELGWEMVHISLSKLTNDPKIALASNFKIIEQVKEQEKNVAFVLEFDSSVPESYAKSFVKKILAGSQEFFPTDKDDLIIITGNASESDVQDNFKELKALNHYYI